MSLQHKQKPKVGDKAFKKTFLDALIRAAQNFFTFDPKYFKSHTIGGGQFVTMRPSVSNYPFKPRIELNSDDPPKPKELWIYDGWFLFSDKALLWEDADMADEMDEAGTWYVYTQPFLGASSVVMKAVLEENIEEDLNSDAGINQIICSVVRDGDGLLSRLVPLWKEGNISWGIPHGSDDFPVSEYMPVQAHETVGGDLVPIFDWTRFHS